jgi:hypothetical protein
MDDIILTIDLQMSSLLARHLTRTLVGLDRHAA